MLDADDRGTLVNFSAHHITFATGRYGLSATLLAATARRHGLNTTIYRPGHTVLQDLAQRYPEIMSVRKGAGFWLWKPFIIRHALSQAQEGDAVIYTDAGMIVVGDPALLLGVTRDHPVVLFRSGTGQPQRTWTKRDCFVLLDADAPEYWDTPQLLGGIQLYRAGPEASAFVDKLCAAMPNVNVLTDAPNICGLPNLPEFLDHRHDQAILTIMAQKEGIPIFPQPTQWGRPDFSSDVPFGQVFQLHGKKDLDVLGWYFRWLTGLPVRGPTQTKPR